MPKIAERLFDARDAECEIEMELDRAKCDYEKLGWDHYDCSLEIYGVDPSWRMPIETQKWFRDEAGFAKVYVNHTDEWQTHYSWGWNGAFEPVRGWRRRYVRDPNAKTDRVIAGPPDPGYYQISYWPEGWDRDLMKRHGEDYFRIVPDPLEIAIV